MDDIKVAIIQMEVITDKEKNINKAEKMINQAVERSRSKVDLVILPEMFNCPYQTDFFSKYSEEGKGYTYQKLSKIAIENDIYLVGGSIPERDGERLFNTSYIFDNRGKQIGKYRKIHLFDIDIQGGQTFKESDTLSSGNNIDLIKTPFATIGVIICYDLRFPELSRILVEKGADIIIVPAAFNMTTGPAHWEILFRTRALDNQVYLLGAAPARVEDSNYISYGNSIVVDPWGRVLSKLDKEEDVLIVNLNLDLIRQIRNELPLLKHRRKDLYKIKIQ